MTLGKLLSPEFQKSLRELSAKGVPPTVAFRLSGIVKKVQGHLDDFEKVRKDAINELAKKDEEGKPVENEQGFLVFEGENQKEMQKRIDELCAIEVELPTIKLAELGAKVELAAYDVIALEGVLVE